jgi:O-methyltransferase
MTARPASQLFKSLARLNRLRMRVAPLSPFERRFRAVEPHTMLGVQRLARLYNGVTELAQANVPGDIVECGVARGGSSLLMALALVDTHSSKELFLFDTFEGLPPASPEGDPDFEIAKNFTGRCRGTYEEVSELLTRHDVIGRTHFIKGRYSDTLPHQERFPIAFLHVDCDWYESVKLCLETFYPWVSKGGIIQIDDYFSWAGAKKATDEFFANRGQRVQLNKIDRSGVWLRV